MSLYKICALMVIFITGCVDFYAMVIADLSWIGLLVLYVAEYPQYFLPLSVISLFVIAFSERMPTIVLGFGQGDWFYGSALIVWIGAGRAALLLGLASSLALGYEAVKSLLLQKKMNWNKKVAWGGYASIAAILLLWP